MRKYVSLWLLIAALGINIFFRLQPAFLPSTKDMAEVSVLTDINKEAAKALEGKFKDFPAQAKFKIVQELVDEQLKLKRSSIDRSMRNKQKEIRSYWQDDSGQTFLSEIDPYHWFRLVTDLDAAAAGAVSKASGRDQDAFMLAPQGMKKEVSLHKNLHVYLSRFILKLARTFNKNIPFTPLAFYIPVFISCLALITVFLFCASIGREGANISGFFAALALGLIPVFLRRSLAGWFDTDPYVILFSLLSAWLFFLSLKYEARTARLVFFALLGGACIGLFSLTWDGWWYIFYLIVFSALYYTVNSYLIPEAKFEKLRHRRKWLSLLLFVSSSFIFVIIFCGAQAITHLASGPAKIIFSKDYLQGQFWPNAFFTVGELREAGLEDILHDVGGAVPVFFSFIYLLAMVYQRKNKAQKQRQFIGFLFFFWLAVILFVSMRAVRFALLGAVPLSISFGLFSEKLIDFLDLRLKRLMNVGWSKAAVFFLVFCAFIFSFYRSASGISSSVPLMNRDWFGVLNKIRTQTPKTAIINSWWDYGHWFKAIGQRRVLFDGATQNTPISYWMARALLTDDERQAYGILRMLNSGSNTAFEELKKTGIEEIQCLKILNEIIPLKKDAAAAALAKYNLAKEARGKVISATHSPAEAYFVIEPSLMPKMPSISFLGNWDFKKARVYQEFHALKKEEFVNYLTAGQGYTPEAAGAMHRELLFLDTKDARAWISPALRYYSQSHSARKEGNLILFDNGFVVDLSNYRAYFNDIEKNKWGIPKSIAYIEGALLKEKQFSDSDMGVSVLLIREGQEYRLIVMDPPLVRCVLTRLYYLNGLGLNYFKVAIEQKLKDSEDKITVYRIDWEGDV